jgi:hypothetical protein
MTDVDSFRFYFAYQMDSDVASDSEVMNREDKHYL